MDDDRRQLSIGKFASLTGISANTLRRYDRLGLLSPAATDPLTSYRIYDIEQLDIGILIRLLRDIDVPLDDVRRLVRSPVTGDVEDTLLEHREHILARREELDRILARIDAVLHEHRGMLPYEVDVVDLREVWVVSTRTMTSRARLDDVINAFVDQLIAELARAGHEPAGREFVLYHNPLQWYQGLDMEACLPVERTVAEAVGGRRLPASCALQTIYRGPWDDIWQAYAAMLARMSRKGYETCGPVRETYLVDERDTDDPDSYMTEITWPAIPRPRADEGETS
jgi:DNA-binding transcriptional MerR regulator